MSWCAKPRVFATDDESAVSAGLRAWHAGQTSWGSASRTAASPATTRSRIATMTTMERIARCRGTAWNGSGAPSAPSSLLVECSSMLCMLSTLSGCRMAHPGAGDPGVTGVSRGRHATSTDGALSSRCREQSNRGITTPTRTSSGSFDSAMRRSIAAGATAPRALGVAKAVRSARNSGSATDAKPSGASAGSSPWGPTVVGSTAKAFCIATQKASSPWPMAHILRARRMPSTSTR
mmetsp:Transcript_42417/g.130990  ORF Transcript_42417/g.130990 Transcript_42417/m.130990 type:complete len:235 (+) Transcript_42417:697-1401(+)